MIKMIKPNKKTMWAMSICSLIQVICFIVGFFILEFFQKTTETVVPTTFLELIPKVQENPMQNFLWCFTNNLAILFLAFWVNYWTWGILGTVWCASSSFIIGTIIKFSLVLKLWVVPIFACLELSAVILVVLSSIYYRFEKKLEKEQRHKGIISVYAIVVLLLIIAAIIETFVLKSIR